MRGVLPTAGARTELEGTADIAVYHITQDSDDLLTDIRGAAHQRRSSYVDENPIS